MNHSISYGDLTFDYFGDVVKRELDNSGLLIGDSEGWTTDIIVKDDPRFDDDCFLAIDINLSIDDNASCRVDLGYSYLNGECEEIDLPALNGLNTFRLCDFLGRELEESLKGEIDYRKHLTSLPFWR